MADRLRVSTRTARSKGYARKNTTPRFTRGWFLMRMDDLLVNLVPYFLYSDTYLN